MHVCLVYRAPLDVNGGVWCTQLPCGEKGEVQCYALGDYKCSTLNRKQTAGFSRSVAFLTPLEFNAHVILSCYDIIKVNT